MHAYRCPNCRTTVSLSVLAVPVCTAHAPCDMEKLPDSAQALLPMDPTATPGVIVPLKVDLLHHAGILTPETQHALDWLYRHRETNGMAGAFLKVGGRRCIDLVAFARLMREKRA